MFINNNPVTNACRSNSDFKMTKLDTFKSLLFKFTDFPLRNDQFAVLTQDK